MTSTVPTRVGEARDLAEVRLAVERDDDVESLRAGRLHPARQPSSSSRSRSASAAARSTPVRRLATDRDRTRRRRVVQIRHARRPHVRRDAVLVRQPQQRSHVVDERMVDRAVLLRHLDALEPLGKSLRTSFWKNPFAPMPAGYRSIVTGRPRMCGSMQRRDRFVVRGQLALGDAVVRETAPSRDA